jgi:hypothetical protein
MNDTKNASYQEKISNLPLLNCFATRLEFGEHHFEMIFCDDKIKISRDTENFALVTLKNQQVPYKANILGGFAFSEEIFGTIDFKSFFYFLWPDDHAVPEIEFFQKPSGIIREYAKGQKIELGIEDISRYHVIYHDGVTADFNRIDQNSWDFCFSTGFDGSFKTETDGTHSIRFKGIRLDADEDGYKSESKFIISRSRFTNNLLLILQDHATVLLQH